MFDRALQKSQRWLGDASARMALRCANMGVVNRRLMRSHDRALSRHRNKLPELAGLDLKIVEGLRRDGMYKTSLAELGVPGWQELLREGQALGATFADDARRQSAQGTDYTMVSPDAVAAHPNLFAWGLHDRLLDIVEAYLGVGVAYDGVTLMYTVAGAPVEGPRRWHLDWEDRRTVKVAVYCNDVSGDGGPFQMIRRKDPVQGGAGGYHYLLADDALLGARLGAGYEDDLVSCEGPAGTVLFCETAQYFHRGKPALKADRVAFFFSYFARRPRHPFFCERSGLSRSQIAGLARSLNPRQRASALWRHGLPLLLRLIPPAGL
ncbi:hypothetical protein FHW96_002624 [Novosphingobium sp. SG751A]|uniref:hypothetical protein n=1 Tax=Novosphingobium sp. SG751A TaxID=2587000 RepID=UPI0020A66C7C|nr:hypothetical protein [Novosphingobium sp. SG751A]NOW46464.1 hypothetical protein [Novosphingobium sp. SG751A]